MIPLRSMTHFFKPSACLLRTLAAGTLLLAVSSSLGEEAWVLPGSMNWNEVIDHRQGMTIEGGYVVPDQEMGTLRTRLQKLDSKQKALTLTIAQSPGWHNWHPSENIGPTNLRDAPVFLSLGPDNYWIFGRYGNGRPKRKTGEQPKAPQPFKPEAATLEGFDIPLQTTPFPKQFDAPGGLKPKLRGYHAWQSRDMIHWVHHGPITTRTSAWMTSAEFADGKAYFYYDFPNDQDPHVYVDADLFDGLPGENKGMAYSDPTHGSDSGIIRDLDGRFHLIVEDWSPINAQRHAWDSPLAAHAVSPNGINGFELLAPAVDERTTPTGKFGTYEHPHWTKENPEKFSSNVGEYEIHEPEQNAYGDWAAIAIGGQYYLFCDHDPADSKTMSVGWFTSPSLDERFTWCGHIGKGHPDPDIMFAEGRFYLVTQQATDWVSPGPWVEKVEARVGVDTGKDGEIDQWTAWTEVSEAYDYLPGFSKQVAKTPASMDVSTLPEGHGFQIELKITDASGTHAKPMIKSLELTFE